MFSLLVACSHHSIGASNDPTGAASSATMQSTAMYVQRTDVLAKYISRTR